MTDAPALICRNLTRRYAARAAVEAVSFVMQPRRVTALLGPSGCGKSTLLRLIAGLEPLDDGEIVIAGATMSTPRATTPPERRGVGLVFQDHALFPHLNVRGNIGFGLAALPAAARAARVDALIERFHLSRIADAWPHMLSGGEAQRVAIARALARDPALLLLDEPFSGLDGSLREAVRDALFADLASIGATVLVVTHDPDEAMAIADDLVLMHQGRIVQQGAPADCYRQPASLAAARLLGDALALDCIVTGGTAHSCLGRHDAPDVADGPATLVVRPDAIGLAAGGAIATVQAVRPAGGGYRFSALIGEETVSLTIADSPPAPGTRIGLALRGPVSGIFARSA